MIQSSQDICVRVNEVAVAQLGQDGVGGYVWSMGQLPPGLVLVGEPERKVGSDVGGGAALEVKLKAEAPGRYVVLFELKRTWGNLEPSERREVVVEVR